MNSKPPEAFCINPHQFKAFVLSCEPNAFDKNKNRHELEYIFDMGNDERYFSSVFNNLVRIGLSLEDLYVQNIVTDYQATETAKNKNWLRTAQNYIPKRKEEFDTVDPSFKKPVFLTSEYLYRLLLNDDLKRLRAYELYKLECTIPIPEQNNKLDRPLFPLYRHPMYNLKNWDNYIKKVKDYFF
ncbi:MAG: hypothetical protein PHV06_10640 [bacterium]|nr:hypothetical protein [bacterium]